MAQAHDEGGTFCGMNQVLVQATRAQPGVHDLQLPRRLTRHDPICLKASVWPLLIDILKRVTQSGAKASLVAGSAQGPFLTPVARGL